MYDVIIIGAGPAGLTAGLYAGRGRLKVKIFEKMMPGGQVLLTERIDNFPGFPGGVGANKLIDNFISQLKELDLIVDSAEIREIRKDSNFNIKTSDDKEFEAKTIIIATGAQYKNLGINGEEKLKGKGICYCAICDAPLFKDKHVSVIGGGNQAVEEALTLGKFADKVTLMHRRDQLRADKVLQEKILKDKKIEVLWDTIPLEFLGEERIESIKIKNVKSQKEDTLMVDGVFISVGMKPNTNFIKKIVKLDENGYVVTDDDMATSLNGVFACGDCRKKSLRQVITACSEGAICAYSVSKILENKIS